MAKTRRRGHGEGTIAHRSSDGRWVAALSLPSGKRKYLYAGTRKEAAEKLRAAQRELDNGLNVRAGQMTVAQYLDEWLTASVKPSVKVKTYEGYESIVRVRVVPRIGKKQLAKLSPLDLQGLCAALAGTGLSARSIHHTHRCLHRAFEQAVKWGMIPRNPCDGVTPPRAEQSEMSVLTQEQVNTLLAATTEHPAHALYVLAITTGMRAGELLGLKWGDIDFATGRLAVKRALQQQNDAGLVFVTPKSARSRRTIVLSKRAIDALRVHCRRQAILHRQLGGEWQNHDLVFANATGGPLDPSWQRQVFYKALDAAGLPHIRFHDLRHTAATLLLLRGVNVKLVSEMLGHASITLTLQTYSHLLPVMHGDAAAAMDAILAEPM